MSKNKRQYLYKGIILIIIAAVILFFAFYEKKEVTAYSKGIFYMNTYINVKIYSDDSDKARKALDEVDNIYNKYHMLTDRYNAYENVKNIYYINNELEKDKKVKIEKELYDVIKYSIEAYDKTNGYFNIALGNAIDVWKRYRDQGYGVPAYTELSNVGSLSIRDITLYDNYNISKSSGVKLDLGGISKGYATEVAGEYLESIGLDKYLINAGGNVKAGNHYKNSTYKIGIEEPKKDSNEIYKIVKGNNISVITSGSYERFYEYNGEIYHHIIDPNTLYPTNYFYSVTIITKDSKLGDVLSTSIFLMKLEDGQKYINSLKDVEAIWYGRDGRVYYSEGFKKYE